jgi:Predicted hydrolases or acyltransferases (alpha/beta hydrolase superfamily)
MNLNKDKITFLNCEELVYYYSDNLNDMAKCFVMISGWGTPSTLLDMYLLATELATENAVVIIERFGQYGSSISQRERNFNNITSEINQVVQKIKTNFNGEITLVGHSLGGFLVYEYAKRFTDIQNIILLDAVPIINCFTPIIYSLNYFFAYIFILLRKTKLIKKLSSKSLLNSMTIKENNLIPTAIIDSTLQFTYGNIYNRNTFTELAFMKKEFANMYQNIIKLSHVTITSVVRNQTNKLAQTMQKQLVKQQVSMKIINLGKSSHYLHNEFTKEVSEICQKD